jgi:hypothetical protein
MLDKPKSKKITDELIPYSSTTIKAARLLIVVRGRTPLLTHNPQSMGTAPEAGRGSRIPEAEVEAEAGCYRMEDGSLAIKGEAFRGSILGAAGAWKVKRATMKSRLSHIVVIEDLVQLVDSNDGKPLTSYIIDSRRAIIMGKGIVRRRPRFDRWGAQFTVEYDPVLVAEPKLIVDICADAGGRIGVGDFRPARNGWFGRYDIVSYLVLE